MTINKTLTTTEIERKLAKAKEAKKTHKSSRQCDAKNGNGCTACHFWSGTISAYSSVLGEEGIID